MSRLGDYLIDGYLPSIGIECHVQLNTKTKLFTGVGNDARQSTPNSLVGPLCIGLPGTLPVINEAAVAKAIVAGLSLNAEIADVTRFDRKHYFYPDLPLGYQISQFDKPIVREGSIPINTSSGSVEIGIERAHLEADAGKLSHPEGKDYSLVDLNRAGTPLLEIVSKPEMHSAEEAKLYARELYLRMLYSGVSDCDLYHGNIRFDVNVSVSKEEAKLGTRSETKNLNSFKNVQRAVEHEIMRQIALIEGGGTVVQETRGWDESAQKTFSQRSKEDAHDYRYMPDPDIPPLEISSRTVEQVKRTLPLGPQDYRNVFSKFGLSNMQTETIIDTPESARIMALVVDSYDAATALILANWITGEVLRMIKDEEVDWTTVEESVPKLAELASMVDSNKLSSTASKELIPEIVSSNVDPLKLATDRNLLQISDESELVILVQKIMSDNPKAVQDATADPKAIGFLVGQVMQASKGKANPKIVSDLIAKYLS